MNCPKKCPWIPCPHTWRSVFLAALQLLMTAGAIGTAVLICAAIGQCADGTTEKGGVYECTTDCLDGAVAQGSCVAIAQNTYLTIGHQVKDATTIHVRRGKTRDVLTIRRRFETKPERVILLQDVGPVKHHRVYPLSTTRVKVGQTCWMVGYEWGRWRDARCRIVAVDDDQIIFSPMPDHGMSGGGVINEAGELVGIISGKDTQRREGVAVSTTSVRIVEPIQQWICGPSGCRPPQNYVIQERIIPHVFRPPTVIRNEWSTAPTQAVPQPTVTASCNCENCGNIDLETIDSLVKQEMARIWNEEKESLRGRDGQDAPEVTVQQIASYLMEHHRDELRGRDGSDSNVDLSPIVARIVRLETQKRRVVLTNGQTVIDDEQYAADEPIVLDFKKIQKQVNSQ